MTQARRLLGSTGETAVTRWYEERGYSVLDRNWRCRDGELDIVLGLGDLVVFCEVKTRTTDTFGAPVEAVTRPKQVRLRRLAGQWLAESAVRAGDVRFDVASVLDGTIEVYENAF